MKKNLLIMIITLSLILVLGSSFAYLMYTKESTNSYVINVGTLEVTFVDSKTEFLNLTNMYPMTDKEGMSLEQELVFQVKNTGNLVANYNIYIEELSTEPEFKTVIKYIVNKDNKGYNEPKVLNDDKYIESEGKLKVGETSEYHVKVWLMETADNTYMNKEFKAKVIVEGNQNLDKGIPLLDTIKEAITTHTTDSCKPTVTDDNDTPEDSSDDTIYFSGDNDCVNFNYVWYSGKLWRIVAINPDDSIKLVTQDAITSIYWGADTKYENSWIYQWLNEDFKDTLYNYENIIVQDAKWNATIDEKSTAWNDNIVKPETLPSQTIVGGDVGLLNAYEYAQAYKNASTSTNYLNIGYYWLSMTPTGSSVFLISYNGTISLNTPYSHAMGFRPSINLKPNIRIETIGDGSNINPYRINGDKSIGISGELINTRLSGEYIKVDNKLYRIVGIENGTTKLTSVDYVRDDSGEVLKKKFGITTSWATSVTSESDEYWGFYLNNTWLTSELRKYIIEGTYYLGRVEYNSTQVGYSSSNYKNSICLASNTKEPTSSCEKTTSTWTGLVGLPRIGEMFSTQLGKGYSTSNGIWLITPTSSSTRYLESSGSLSYYVLDLSEEFAVRPSIYLKPEVIITRGDGMSPDTAYTIDLPKSN